MNALKIKLMFVIQKFSLRFVAGLFVAGLLLTRVTAEEKARPFEPTLESLKQYECPEWFRDAKFGIWSHWGPQSVPMEGDWYARNMYIPGQRQYQQHLETYGHPSTNGWKDIIPLWKAEKFDPDRLMALYKKAGAKYFVSMGVHHDNFDLWASKYQRWNAVNFGPQRDIVGAWQQAAKKQGLPFGVSEHLGASFWWWQVNKQSDTNGPFAGVPYDGANPEFQDLYHWPAAASDTNNWYSSDPRWQEHWLKRITDLVDSYHPDLLYSDGGPAFYNATGYGLIAHLYNTHPNPRGGKVQAVYTSKQRSEGRWVEDVERGVMPGINPEPWQTDTSIGDWFYNKHWKFRPVSWTIHMLVDIVSKNGNLLLNVVQRPDGTLDPEVEQDLTRLSDWMSVNGEGIYGTRPWLIHGEGPVRAKGGHFKEDFAYTARDIRFTAKGDQTLYAFALGWPENGRLEIASVARLPGVKGRISDVRLLGHRGKLKWTHDATGLHVQLPAHRPCDHAVALKITGKGLREFKPVVALAAAAVTERRTSDLGKAPTHELFPGQGPAQAGDWFDLVWTARKAEFAANKVASKGGIVFLGDSITQGWGDPGQRFPGYRCVNRGISGDTTRGILFRLQEDVLDLSPEAIVLLIGTNDIDIGAKSKEIANNLAAILAAVHRANSKTPVIVCKVMPSHPSKKRPADRIQKLNALVDDLLKQYPQCVRCDTWSIYADGDGNATLAEFPDLLHLNSAGYDKWVAALKLLFAQLKLSKSAN